MENPRVTNAGLATTGAKKAVRCGGDGHSLSQTSPFLQQRKTPVLPLDAISSLRLQRGAEHLHTLGPRAMVEYLKEVAAIIGGLPAMLSTLEEYQRRLNPERLRAAGGDRFPPRMLAEVPR